MVLLDIVDDSPIKKFEEPSISPSISPSSEDTTQQQEPGDQFHFRNVIAQGCIITDKNGSDFKITSIEPDLIVLEEVNGGIEHDYGEGIVLRMYSIPSKKNSFLWLILDDFSTEINEILANKLQELQGKSVIDALEQQEHPTLLSTEEQAFVFEDDAERCRIAMDYLKTTWINRHDETFDKWQESKFSKVVMYCKQHYEQYLTSQESELLDEIFDYLCCMSPFFFNITDYDFNFSASQTKNSEFFAKRDMVEDMKALGCTTWIGKMVSGFVRAKNIDPFVCEMLMLPVWSACIRQGFLRIGPDFSFCVVLWVCIIGMQTVFELFSLLCLVF